MSVLIESIGCYFPAWRLSAKDLRGASIAVPRGLASKPVCAVDEDVLTMAVDAAKRAVDHQRGRESLALDGVALASTGLPYLRRVQSGMVVDALGLDSARVVTEATTSARAAVEALLAVVGAWAMSEGDGDNRSPGTLLVASDAPAGGTDALASDDEAGAGAGATAMILAPPVAGETGALGSSSAVGRIEAVASCAEEWPGLGFVRRIDARGRDIDVSGYAEAAMVGLVQQAVKRALRGTGTSISDFRFVALGTREGRITRKLAAALDLEASQWQSVMGFSQLGDQGANGPLVNLAGALDEAEAGDRILVVAYGEGSAADAIVATAGPGAGQGEVRRALGSGVPIGYLTYLRSRGGM